MNGLQILNRVIIGTSALGLFLSAYGHEYIWLGINAFILADCLYDEFSGKFA